MPWIHPHEEGIFFDSPWGGVTEGAASARMNPIDVWWQSSLPCNPPPQLKGLKSSSIHGISAPETLQAGLYGSAKACTILAPANALHVAWFPFGVWVRCCCISCFHTSAAGWLDTGASVVSQPFQGAKMNIKGLHLPSKCLAQHAATPVSQLHVSEECGVQPWHVHLGIF